MNISFFIVAFISLECLEKYGLSCDLCVGVCTDGAPSMVGSMKGFTSLVEKQNPNIVRTHCLLHREVLCSKITQMN